MLMAVANMVVLMTSTTATGPAKAQINPVSVDSQQLTKERKVCYMA